MLACSYLIFERVEKNHPPDWFRPPFETNQIRKHRLFFLPAAKPSGLRTVGVVVVGRGATSLSSYFALYPTHNCLRGGIHPPLGT